MEHGEKIMQHYFVVPYVQRRYRTQRNVLKHSRGVLFGHIKVDCIFVRNSVQC